MEKETLLWDPEHNEQPTAVTSSSDTRRLKNVGLSIFLFLAAAVAYVFNDIFKFTLNGSHTSPPQDISHRSSIQNISHRSSNQNISNQPAALSSKDLQIQNYKLGKALIVSTHITHHAGTFLCHIMRDFGGTPSISCLNDKEKWPKNVEQKGVWSYNDTAFYVQNILPLFHFVSREYKSFGNLHSADWENENLVSIIVMRNPLDRFLAHGRCGEYHSWHGDKPPREPSDGPTARDYFWQYANSQCADNFALKVLAHKRHCVDGADTPKECLEKAKELLRRFTFIVDQDCFNDSVYALGQALDLNIPKEPNNIHVPARERIDNETLYEFLNHRFRRDIELYEWSKKHSIIKC